MTAIQSSRVRIVVENPADQQLMAAIYQSEKSHLLMGVDSCLTTSGAISTAELSLLQRPRLPVALVLNSRSDDLSSNTELLATVKRILARAAPENWHVALAIPRLDAWAMQDPDIKADFQSRYETRDGAKDVYAARAARMAELVRKKPFNREALRQASVQFRGLDDFIRQHLNPTPVSSPVSF